MGLLDFNLEGLEVMDFGLMKELWVEIDDDEDDFCLYLVLNGSEGDRGMMREAASDWSEIRGCDEGDESIPWYIRPA